MKRVYFEYYDNDMIPPAVVGLGMYSNMTGPINGYYIGILTEDNEDYLVSKTIDTFSKNDKYIDKIVVRKVFPDIENNELCIDNEADKKCVELERQYNNGEKSTDTVIEAPNEKYEKLIKKDTIDVRSLKHDDYEKRKMIIETGPIYPKQRTIKYY